MPHIKPRSLHSQHGVGYHGSFLGVAGEALALNDIVVATGYSGDRITFSKADANAAGLNSGVMGVADHAAASGQSVRVVSHKLITGVNTSAAYAAGYPVYLSDTAGGWSTSNESSMVAIGSVVSDHASTGAVLIAPAASKSPDNSNYLKFITGDYHGLTLTSLANDAAVDAGATLTANSFTEAPWDGGGAAAIVLPAAIPTTLCVFKFTGVADGGANITFTTAGTDTYAVQTLDLSVLDAVAEGPCVPRFIGHDFVTADLTEVTAPSSAEILTIAATATNNQTNTGAELAFYCQTAGEWRVAFQGSQLGTGAINGTFAFTSA